MGVGCLPDFALDAGRPLGREFVALGLGGYREAAHHVRYLPYGRNSDRSDWRLVLKEGRGTCSTKHALLAELARVPGERLAPNRVLAGARRRFARYGSPVAGSAASVAATTRPRPAA
jgi:hypothetical protein